MKLTWLGHACFRLDTDCGSVVFDPFRDGSVPGYRNIRETADMVLCSHEHGDHGARECVTLTGREPAFRVIRIPCFHDDAEGAKRGNNIIHIIEAEGLRAAHFGDLGHMLSPEQIQALGKLDLAMIPVGGFYTIDAQTAKQARRRARRPRRRADALPFRALWPGRHCAARRIYRAVRGCQTYRETV